MLEILPDVYVITHEASDLMTDIERQNVNKEGNEK